MCPNDSATASLDYEQTPKMYDLGDEKPLHVAVVSILSKSITLRMTRVLIRPQVEVSPACHPRG